jgi:hypothetical protein
VHPGPDPKPCILPIFKLTLTVRYRSLRFLMLWLFVVLQAMAPFIHAHAGAVRAEHGGFLHLHQGIQGDVTYHAMAADEHGAEVAVEQGVRLRDSTLDAITEAPLVPCLGLLRTALATRPGADLPLAPLLGSLYSRHTLPHALAPPAA